MRRLVVILGAAIMFAGGWAVGTDTEKCMRQIEAWKEVDIQTKESATAAVYVPCEDFDYWTTR